MTFQKTEWSSPLPNSSVRVPLGAGHVNGFGGKRRNGFNTGIDLLCDAYQPVASVEAGTIVAIVNFSKKGKTKPWINTSRALLIEGDSGVVCYGNVKPNSKLKVGSFVSKGQVVGKVIPIYKNKKNRVCKLKLEWYTHGTRRRSSWNFNKDIPGNLLNPTHMLLPLIVSTTRGRSQRAFSST